jgi:hypothetical protein
VAHTADEIVADLHGLLHAASIREPYVLVAHSIGGIYTRKYADLYLAEVAGVVLVDSAHEEQFTRVAQISPEWAKRISNQFPVDEQRSQGFLLGDERLTWHFDKPLVVIEHGKMPPPAASDPMAKQSEAVFHVLQKDLANRSKHGQLREAKTSGHYIQRDQPELVTQSIRDVIRESATLITAKPRRRQISRDESSATLTLPDYGRFARHSDKITRNTQVLGIALNEALALICPMGSFVPKSDHGIDAHGEAGGQVSSDQTDRDHDCSGKDNRTGTGDWQVGDQAGG